MDKQHLKKYVTSYLNSLYTELNNSGRQETGNQEA